MLYSDMEFGRQDINLEAKLVTVKVKRRLRHNYGVTNFYGERRNEKSYNSAL